MYVTHHPDGREGSINYTVWSDIYVCPYCQTEITYYDVARDEKSLTSSSDFRCPKCKAKMSTRLAERAVEEAYDPILNSRINITKRIPIEIHYSIGNKRHKKRPDEQDLTLIEKINQMNIPYWFPSDRMPPGDEILVATMFKG